MIGIVVNNCAQFSLTMVDYQCSNSKLKEYLKYSTTMKLLKDYRVRTQGFIDAKSQSYMGMSKGTLNKLLRFYYQIGSSSDIIRYLQMYLVRDLNKFV